jgi:Zn-dependent protease with chaperone function
LEGKPSWLLIPVTLALPICLGIAITRYRLFDIDVIIRRTLIYAILSGLLAVGYLASVLILQNLFGLLTGNSRSELTTVISTLAIAAVFVPLRGAVQRVIDRRLYRRKYDAARTLAAFAAAARDEVELDRLSRQLVTTVQDAMQPEAVSLWLKPSASPSAEPKA